MLASCVTDLTNSLGLASASQTDHFNLFNAPRELRDRIYSCVAHTFNENGDNPVHPTLTVWTDREDSQDAICKTWTRLTDLSMVSKQFAHEFRTIWLSEHIFEFSYTETSPHGDVRPAPHDYLNFYDVLAFLQTLTKEERNDVKHLRIVHEIERSTKNSTADEVERALQHAPSNAWPPGCIIELQLKRMRAAPYNHMRVFRCTKDADGNFHVDIDESTWPYESREDFPIGYWTAESESRMRSEEASRRHRSLQ